MFLPAHLAAGLIIGKLTNNYPASLAGALAMDLDHLISYFENGILFKPPKFIAAITDKNDPWGDQRYYLHNILSWLVISGIIFLIDSKFGLAFGLAYLSHLVLDIFDDADFFPFFPQ